MSSFSSNQSINSFSLFISAVELCLLLHRTCINLSPFVYEGIKAKVSDFGLRGMARIVLKPLISEIPLIGGVQVYFLKPPEIDYSLGGVAGALEIPGINKIVENVIIEQIKNFVVLPNKFSLSLVDSIPKKTLKCPDSAGVLRVKLLRAANLVDR